MFAACHAAKHTQRSLSAADDSQDSLSLSWCVYACSHSLLQVGSVELKQMCNSCTKAHVTPLYTHCCRYGWLKPSAHNTATGCHMCFWTTDSTAKVGHAVLWSQAGLTGKNAEGIHLTFLLAYHFSKGFCSAASFDGSAQATGSNMLLGLLPWHCDAACVP